MGSLLTKFFKKGAPEDEPAQQVADQKANSREWIFKKWSQSTTNFFRSINLLIKLCHWCYNPNKASKCCRLLRLQQKGDLMVVDLSKSRRISASCSNSDHQSIHIQRQWFLLANLCSFLHSSFRKLEGLLQIAFSFRNLGRLHVVLEVSFYVHS